MVDLPTTMVVLRTPESLDDEDADWVSQPLNVMHLLDEEHRRNVERAGQLRSWNTTNKEITCSVTASQSLWIKRHEVCQTVIVLDTLPETTRQQIACVLSLTQKHSLIRDFGYFPVTWRDDLVILHKHLSHSHFYSLFIRSFLSMKVLSTTETSFSCVSSFFFRLSLQGHQVLSQEEQPPPEKCMKELHQNKETALPDLMICQ